MSWQQRHLAAEAVFFLRGDDIVAAMKYDDFREYLLGGRQIPPFLGESVRGVFVSVGDGLAIRAACCFRIDFDATGIPSSEWNVPVRELAHNSGDGPDLGHGTIRLACRAQCSIPWHSGRLWGVEIDETVAVLRTVQAAVRQNSLGLRVEPPRPRVPSLLRADRARRADGSAPARPTARRAEAAAAPDREPRTPRATGATTHELPAQRMAAAAKRFDTEFGPAARVGAEHLGGAAAEETNVARLRAKHAAELARLRSAHEREVSAMQHEIERLRKLLRAASEV